MRGLFKRGKARNRLWHGHDLMAKAQFIGTKVERFVRPGARHLDIACGDGQVLLAFSEMGCKSIGIEMSSYRLARCKAKDLSIVRADMIAPLPFETYAFDVVTLISTIEHVLQPRLLIEEVDRVLSLNGLIIIQIPNPHFPIDLHYFLPFYGYLPPPVRRIYRRRFAGQGYAIRYYTAQISRADLEGLLSGRRLVHTEDIVYPIEIVPNWLKPFYRFYKQTMLHRLFPTGHLFIYCGAGSQKGRQFDVI